MTFNPTSGRTMSLVLVLSVCSLPSPRITASTLRKARPNTQIAVSQRIRYVVKRDFYQPLKEKDVDPDVIHDFAVNLSRTIADKNRVILPDMEPSLPCDEESPCEQVCFREQSIEIRHGVDELRIEVWLMRDPKRPNEDPRTTILRKEDPAGLHSPVSPPNLTWESVREDLMKSMKVPNVLKTYDNDPNQFPH